MKQVMQMNTEQTVNKHEMLSALADGQLRGAAFAQAVEWVQHDEEAQATWHGYHLIGDVMRSGELARCDGDSAFLARLQTRLKQEPGFPRPESADVQPARCIAPAVKLESTPLAGVDAANAPNFRWKMLAGFASMAAVAAIGWNLVGAPGALPAASEQIALASGPAAVSTSSLPSTGSPLQLVGAVVPSPASAAPDAQTTQGTQVVTLPSGEPQVMIRDPRLDELMAAHKQFGGTSALQMPAGFLRNATFEVPAR